MKKQTKNKTWRKVKLGELGKVITGKTPPTADPENFGDKYPFITIPDLQNQKYIYHTERYLSDKGASVMKNLKLPSDSVILSCLATVGECGITIRDSFTNQQINSIICDKKKVIPQFLYYSFKFIKPILAGVGGGGSVYTNISKSKFSNIEIPLPALDEQKRIADILSAFDDKIELNNKISRTLEEMASAIFKEWFVEFRFPGWKKVRFVDSELGKIPEGWGVKKLEEIAQIEYGKGPAGKDFKTDGYSVYGANGIIGYYGKYEFEEPQIIVGCRGVVGSLFKTLPKSSVTHNSLIIKPIAIEKYYLFYLLKQSNLQSVVGGSAQPQITIRDLSQLPMLAAKKDIRNTFDNIVIDLEKKLLNTIYENQKLASLRDLLLPKLMSGEVKVEVEV